MDIVVTTRHTEVDQRFRDCVREKITRLEKLDATTDRVDVVVCEERNPRQSDRRLRVELTRHGRGPVVRAEAASFEAIAALDLAIGKLEMRLRRAADRRRVHHGSRTPVSVAAATRAGLSDLAPEIAPEDQDAGEPPFVVREKEHLAPPMTLDQALLEMELVGHDFFLYVDSEHRVPSVVYRRRGYHYGVLRLRADDPAT